MADPNTEFHGYAIKSKPLILKPKFEPWAYHPRLLGDDDVEIAISHCGICGSDIHTAYGGWGAVEYPIITGHEIVGTVRLKGSNVTEFQIGDRVGVGAQCYACLNREGKSCPGCSSGNENHCEIDHVDTYNGIFKDGQRTQGGYADAYRCDKHFVFNIPDNISSHEAAPLLCAGCTTYSPLVRHGCGPNKRVGIIGLGGLGHLAVQFASKLGAKEVVVFSHSKSKSEIAKQLGAAACVSFEDEEESKKYKSALDIVLVCGNAKDMPWEKYLDVVAFNGIFCSLALPEESPAIPLMPINSKRIQFVGSMIGSLSEIKEMFQFCSKNNVRPMVEVLPMTEVNEGIRRVREGEAKFRIVLQN